MGNTCATPPEGGYIYSMNRILGLLLVPLVLIPVLLVGCISNTKNEWAMRVTQIDKLHDLGFSGKNVRIGLIDTGVDLSKGDFDESKFVAWKDLINGRDDFYDDNGHGTFIAGLLFSRGGIFGGIKGICPDSEVVVVKALSDIGESNDSLISKAIDFCIRSGVDIILLSFYENQEEIEIGENSLENCRKALEKGIIVVAPAGDDGLNDDGDVFNISGIDKVISVGSVGKDLYISPFSSRGNQAEVLGKHSQRIDPDKKPEIVAPGEGIESIYDGGFAERSETAISASFVAGSIALLLDAYPNLKDEKNCILTIKEVLARSAKKLGDEGIYSGDDLKHNDEYGYGLLQAYTAYKMLGGMV